MGASLLFIFNYLCFKKYPEDASDVQKRGIRKTSLNYRIGKNTSGDDILLKKGKQGQDDRIAVYDEKIKQDILQQYHSSDDGGHQGVNTTYAKISSKYYWNHIRENVVEFVRKCDRCQRTNPSLKSGSQSEIHPIPVKRGPFLQWGIDLVGPLKETEDGNKYILAATCYFSKWSEAVALKSKDSSEIAKFLLDLFSRYGGGQVFISDQGREFVNQLVQLVGEKFVIDHRIATPYHPQTNGLQERANQTMQKILQKITNDEQNDWDVKLPSYLFASRSMVQASTGYSPFRIVHGREPTMPVDIDLCEASDVSADVDEQIVEAFDTARNAIFNKVQANISKAQTKMKESFEKSHAPQQPLQVGDGVLVKNSRKVGRKMSKMSGEDNWLGPKGGYQILDILPNGNCVLEGLKRTYNPANLRRYVHDSEAATVTRKPRSRPKSGDAPATQPKPPAPRQRQRQRSEPDDSNVVRNIKSIPKDELRALQNTLKTSPLPSLSNLSHFSASPDPALSFYNDTFSKYGADVEAVGDYIVQQTPVGNCNNTTRVDVAMIASALLVESEHSGVAVDELLPTLQQIPGVVDTVEQQTIPDLPDGQKLCVLNTNLGRADLETLLKNKWLNDQIVNGYLSLVMKEANRNQPKKMFILPSFLAVLWEKEDFDTWLYENVKLTEYDHVLLPICTDHHWVLLVANMQTSSVALLDSIPSTHRRQVWQKKWREFMKARTEAAVETSTEAWNGIILPTHRQEDSNSCGVFLLMHAHAIGRDIDPYVNRQHHVQVFRQHVLAQLIEQSELNSNVCDMPHCNRRNLRINRWISCDGCGRWFHHSCVGPKLKVRNFKCVLCD